MEPEKQKALPLKWIKYPFYIFLIGGFIDRAVGHNCFVNGSIDNLGTNFYFISDILFFITVWLLLRKYNYTIETGEDTTQKLSGIMRFGILFFAFLFGGMLPLITTWSLFDISIWATSNTSVQLKAAVTNAEEHHSTERGGCNGVQYTFYNTPIQTDTTICDRTDSLTGMKVGDVLLVHEKVGFVGARVVNAEHWKS